VIKADDSGHPRTVIAGHDGGAAGAAAHLGEDLPGLEGAIARSPRARIRAWDRLTAFCRRGRCRCRLNPGPHAAAGTLVAHFGEGHHVGAGQRAVMQWVRAAIRLWVEPGSAADAQISRPAGSAMTVTPGSVGAGRCDPSRRPDH
jgi:hypothetical protein